MRTTIALFLAAAALLAFALFARPAPEAPARAAATSDVSPSERTSPEHEAPASAPVALAVVLDRSGSMSRAALSSARDAVLELNRRLRAEDRLAVVSYAGDARLDAALAAPEVHRRYLEDALLDVQGGGGSHVAAGIALAQRALADAPAGARRHILLLTDGRANQGLTDPAFLEALVRRASVRGIGLSAAGLGEGVDRDVVARLAHAGGGRPYAIADAEKLGAAFSDELRALDIVPHADRAPLSTSCRFVLGRFSGD